MLECGKAFGTAVTCGDLGNGTQTQLLKEEMLTLPADGIWQGAKRKMSATRIISFTSRKEKGQRFHSVPKCCPSTM